MKTIEKQETQMTYTSVVEASLTADTDVRFWPETVEVGQGGDQGDLLLWRIESVDGMERVPGVTQLAPGTTQGSRHCLNDPSCWEVYKPANFGKFVNMGTRENPSGHIVGYALVCKDRDRIVHPEHAPHSIPRGVCIQTAGQVDARTLQWAKD